MAKKKNYKRKTVLLVEQGADGVFDLTLDDSGDCAPLLKVNGDQLPADASLEMIAEAVMAHALYLSAMEGFSKTFGRSVTMDEMRAAQKKVKAAKAGK